MSVFHNTSKNPSHENVLDVPAEEVFKDKEQLVLIDVRRPDEYIGELGHVEEAQNIVLDTIPQNIDSLTKDKTIVFICRSGARSGQATEFALNSGFSNVYNMDGGMLAWNSKNLPVVKE